VGPVPGRTLTGTPARLPAGRGRRGRLLAAGAVAFGLVLASYLGYRLSHPLRATIDPVDLAVYRDGGLIVRHVRPAYRPGLAAPLYQWTGLGRLALKFTYPPFAAVVFAVISFVPWPVLPGLSVAAGIACLVAALWSVFGGLGYAGRARLGAALLAAAAVFWAEPVIRTLYLGQVNLALLALLMWDLCQSGAGARRWWRGSGVGIAAGIKLVPLIFVPYLLLTRRFRQAGMAAAGFAVTMAIGAAFLPADSGRWWLGGLFLDGERTGFPGWAGNQSLRGLITRLAGSAAAARPAWLAAAAVAAVAGLACAVLLDRAGQQVAGVLAAALTGLLVSPVSWDHHWVWVAPGAAVAAHYAIRAAAGGQRWRAAGLWTLAAGLLAVFGAWPGTLVGGTGGAGPFRFGLLWQPPNTSPAVYNRLGDRPWFAEYHWHGSQLLTGNAFVLAGLALLAVLVAVALSQVAAAPDALSSPA
jgi:alpha-1,2-mannosyltransferase